MKRLYIYTKISTQFIMYKSTEFQMDNFYQQTTSHQLHIKIFKT